MTEGGHQGNGRLGRRVGGVLGDALSSVLHRVGSATHLIGEVFRLQRHTGSGPHYRAPGQAPGLEGNPDVGRVPEPGEVSISCLDYGPEGMEDATLTIGQLASHPRPEWAKVRWVRVQGLNPYVVNKVRHLYRFNSLAGEDVLDVPQRARAEAYDNEGHLFVVTQMVTTSGTDTLHSQQVSLFVRPELLVSFEEVSSDAWAPLISRMAKGTRPRLRSQAADYLAYAILDVIVDHCYLVLERYGSQLEALEEQVLLNQSPALLQRLHGVRRELAVLRRLLWPTRELLVELRKDEQIFITTTTRAFLADVADHCNQLLDMVDTFRDLSSNLTDLHLSLSNHRMSNVMQVLTLFSVFFIPITFLAGVFGMNFQVLPGTADPDGFWWFCGACTCVGVGLLWYFRRKRWL